MATVAALLAQLDQAPRVHEHVERVCGRLAQVQHEAADQEDLVARHDVNVACFVGSEVRQVCGALERVSSCAAEVEDCALERVDVDIELLQQDAVRVLRQKWQRGDVVGVCETS